MWLVFKLLAGLIKIMVEKKIKKDFSKFKWDFFDLNKVFSVFVWCRRWSLILANFNLKIIFLYLVTVKYSNYKQLNFRSNFLCP